MGNLFIGTNSGYYNKTGNFNIIIGTESGHFIESGNNNLIFGYETFTDNINYNINPKNHYNNLAIGNSIGNKITGNYNTFIGINSCQYYDGSYCSFFGGNSGFLEYTGGIGNTLLGYETTITANDVQYSTAIGYQANVDTSNTIIIGRESEITKIPGKLNVVGDTSLNGNLTVDGSAIFKSSVDVYGNVNINNVTVSNVSVNTLTVNSDAYINGKLRVEGDASFNSNVDISGTLMTRSRAYQQLNFGPSWDAVNGYYGLAKDAYPAVNPYSSGIKAVSTWNVKTTPNNYDYYGVCWSAELGIFVAVSYNGGYNGAMTSRDGINWNVRTLPSINNWYSICWAGEIGLFVAVASAQNNYAVITSPDGINWTTRTTPNGMWRSVCWSAELSLFVAVSITTTNNVMISNDGKSWNAITVPNVGWESVCWSAELSLFVAVAGTTTNNIMTSKNGTEWKSTTFSNYSILSVCWSSELGIFVAVVPSITNGIITSPDGINWTARLIPNTSSNYLLNFICWSAELGFFLALGSNSNYTTSVSMISSDGINWNIATTYNDVWTSASWSPELGIFVAVTYSSKSSNKRVMISSLKGRPPTSYNIFDNSFNNIDENGNWSLKVKLIENLNEKIQINGDVSLNSKLFVGNDVSMNRKLRVAGDASFNSNVDISGNLYMTGNNFIQLSSNKTSSTNTNINSLGGYIQVFDNGTKDILTSETLYELKSISLSTIGFIKNATYLMNGQYYVRNTKGTSQEFNAATFYLTNTTISTMPQNYEKKKYFIVVQKTVTSGTQDATIDSFSFLIDSNDFLTGNMYLYFQMKFSGGSDIWQAAFINTFITRLG